MLTTRDLIHRQRRAMVRLVAVDGARVAPLPGLAPRRDTVAELDATRVRCLPRIRARIAAHLAAARGDGPEVA